MSTFLLRNIPIQDPICPTMLIRTNIAAKNAPHPQCLEVKLNKTTSMSIAKQGLVENIFCIF